MNGLKVYLKSGITKAYFYAQGVLGILFIVNALREYERIEGQKVQLLFSVLAGIALVLGWLMPKKKRRKFRLLPGFLLILGGLSLILLTRSSEAIAYHRYNYLLEVLGFLICIAGVVQPLIDVTKVAYFTSDGIRYRSTIFYSKSISWSEVKGIVYHEEGYSIELLTGKTIRMVPFDANSQNLRVYIDKMRLKAQERAGSKNKRHGEDDGLLHNSTPESVA